ncbi:MAG: RdgB/HAM1 family non-canonical purine NTP pyrophosphatase [Anaerolineales bacterium]|nr:RdgB/HAM1 family non-canonical purine NTP pyrophosphatase [Anaerolineales bacterium]
MRQLLLATNNRHKIIEIQALLKGLNIMITTPSDLNLILEVEENAGTYEENAAQKARAFGDETGLISLADDSGLEVDALGGLPGIYSRRFAPIDGATDADRRAYLLERLTGIPRPWKAHFHCTVALYMAGNIIFTKGDCFGEIIPEERGSHGFGYDPIFLLPEFSLTMAELSLNQKNQVSHRARAIQAAVQILRQHI